MEIQLRDVTVDDVVIFFDHQADRVSSEMAAVASRDHEAHAAHWAKIIAEPTSVNRTIVADGRVAGNVVSWLMDGRRHVGYWIDRSLWGNGIASAALEQFLELLNERPLFAIVATHNAASARVLQKAGFVPSTEGLEPPDKRVAVLGFELR